MKRIKLYQEISKIVAKETISKDHGIKEIVKFIHNNYRRRKYKNDSKYLGMIVDKSALSGNHIDKEFLFTPAERKTKCQCYY